jgi:hypothetical protein
MGLINQKKKIRQNRAENDPLYRDNPRFRNDPLHQDVKYKPTVPPPYNPKTPGRKNMLVEKVTKEDIYTGRFQEYQRIPTPPGVMPTTDLDVFREIGKWEGAGLDPIPLPEKDRPPPPERDEYGDEILVRKTEIQDFKAHGFCFRCCFDQPDQEHPWDNHEWVDNSSDPSVVMRKEKYWRSWRNWGLIWLSIALFWITLVTLDHFGVVSMAQIFAPKEEEKEEGGDDIDASRLLQEVGSGIVAGFMGSRL